MALVGLFCTGLLWLGAVRYQADQRAVEAAASAAAPVHPEQQAFRAPAEPPERPKPQPVMVHVAGAVMRPGVYRLEQGSRVSDALEAAGGALPEGVPDTLNLASHLSDGDKVFVPDRREGPGVPAAQAATKVPVQSESASGSGRKVRLNSAKERELDGLPGITPTTAKAIVAYRNQKGPFKRVEDLDNVSGIGPATIEKIRGHVEL